jgi:phosphoenolpyruvate carboxylase
MLTLLHEKELRIRIRLLTLLLSRVLKQNLEPTVYEAIRELRLGFIALRERDDPDKRQHLSRLVEGMDPATLSQIIRAFSTYFSLLHVAEEAFNLQERRRDIPAQPPVARLLSRHTADAARTGRYRR